MLPDPPYKRRPLKPPARGGQANRVFPKTHGVDGGGVVSGNYGLSSILKLKRKMTGE